MKERNLTPKQQAFVLAYLETGNATESYRRAYDCSNMLSTTVSRKGFELSRKSIIAANIKEAQQAVRDAAIIDRAGVLSLLTDIATADASELSEIQVRCCRHCWGVDHRKQWKNQTEYAIAVAKAIDQNAKDIDRWERDVAIGSKAPRPEPVDMPNDAGGYGFDVFAQPNPECPVCLGEGHTVPVYKDTRRLSPKARRLFAGVKKTKDGLEIKTRSQEQAIEILRKEFKIGIEADRAAAPTAQVNMLVQGDVTVATDPLEAARQYQELMRGSE